MHFFANNAEKLNSNKKVHSVFAPRTTYPGVDEDQKRLSRSCTKFNTTHDARPLGLMQKWI